MTAKRQRSITRSLVVLAGAGAVVTGLLLPEPAADPQLASQAPGWPHVLGTSPYGHDLLALVVVASLRALTYSIWATAITAALGLAIGFAAAAAAGRWLDSAQYQIARVLDSLGVFLIATCLAVIFPHLNLWVLGAVLAALVWPNLAGVVRTETLVVSRESYIEAAVALGVGQVRVAICHVLPAILDRVLPVLTAMLGLYIGVFAALGFLGAGAAAEMNIGFLVYDSHVYLRSQPWYFVTTAGALAVLLLGIVLMENILLKRKATP